MRRLSILLLILVASGQALAQTKAKTRCRSLQPIRNVFNPSRGTENCAACALARAMTMRRGKVVTADDVMRRSPGMFSNVGRIQDWDGVVRKCGFKTVEKRTYVLTPNSPNVEPYVEKSGKVEYPGKYSASGMPAMLRHIATNLPKRATVLISARGSMSHAMNVDIHGPGRAAIVDPQGMGVLEKLQADPSLACYFRVRILQPADR
jgi:hypothetical protein